MKTEYLDQYQKASITSSPCPLISYLEDVVPSRFLLAPMFHFYHSSEKPDLEDFEAEPSLWYILYRGDGICQIKRTFAFPVLLYDQDRRC